MEKIVEITKNVTFSHSVNCDFISFQVCYVVKLNKNNKIQ